MKVNIDNRDKYPLLILLMITVIWGINAPVMKMGLMVLSPLLYNACRLILAAILSVVVLLISKTYKPMPLGDLKKIALLSVAGFFCNQLLIVFGMAQTTAGNASLVLATLPVEVVLINRALKLEAISRRMMAGVIAGLLGVFLVVLGSNKELSLFGPHLLGASLILAGQFCYGYYTVFLKELNTRYSTYQIYAYVMIFNAALFFIIALPELQQIDWSSISGAAVNSIIFSAAFALVTANTIWIWVVGRLGSTKASLSQFLCPVISITIAWFYLDESLGILQIIGAIVILAGLYLTLNQKAAYLPKTKGEFATKGTV